MLRFRITFLALSVSWLVLAALPSPAWATNHGNTPPKPTPSSAPSQPLFSPQPPPSVVRGEPSAKPGGNSPAADARPSPASERGRRLADAAARLAGSRYTWGGMTPATGFDCSGLVYFVYKQAGLAMPRELPSQAATGARVSLADLAPGDVVLFRDTYKAGLSHSGIYLGNGRFVSALDERRGVVVTDIHDQYWRPRFLEGRRCA